MLPTPPNAPKGLHVPLRVKPFGVMLLCGALSWSGCSQGNGTAPNGIGGPSTPPPNSAAPTASSAATHTPVGSPSGSGSASDGTTPASSQPASDAATPTSSEEATDAAPTNQVPMLPPPNAGVDYQLGGDYPPPAGVGILVRDRAGAPDAKRYSICYVNGYQVQPGEESDWDADLLLRDARGDVVIDEDWNEALLDVSNADKRQRIAERVGSWIEQCAADGFAAVEIDNLDTYTRSNGLLDEDDAVALFELLASRAHAQGLAIAQKNSVELAERLSGAADFAVAEECNTYDECDGYIAAYSVQVLMVEYERAAFTRGCEGYGASYSIVLRDRELTRPGDPDYLFEGC